jgi:D-3-phosphoglycerate dehydrogenase / 2-oxoglutarate reductase
VRIINCARGGLVDEAALRAALDSGQVAGAAFDVFVEEPAKANPLFGHPNVICTPHLGASTNEAQENVALQVAEQMADYLLSGAITNAINFPSISAEEAPRLKPFVALADKLGSFLGQLTDAPIKGIRITYEGEVAGMNTRALTSAAVTGVLRPFLADINMVSAPAIARERGIVIDEVKREGGNGDYESVVRITVDAEDMPRDAAGTVFHDGKPRVIEIRSIEIDAAFAPHMLYVRNHDKPGFIGRFGSVLGEAGVNVATFNLGREQEGGNAIAFVAVDGPVSPEVLEQIAAIPQVKRVRAVSF